MKTRENTIVETGICTSAHSGLGGPRQWNCLVASGSSEGKEIVLSARPTVIGADQNCDLILSDPTVSRRHAEISSGSDGIIIRDLGSTNGTYYKASRITEVVLTDNSVVTVGKTQLRIFSKPMPTVTPSSRSRFGGLIGQSIAMREVFAVLELASPTDTTVVIEGQSGTGKELVALAIHDHSKRASGPLVTVDCSAIQENLIDSHLFGHLQGAFTGAVDERKGAFAVAHGGTLFLDEIGELPLASQGKLLRVLEAGTVQPIGSDRQFAVDVRVVAATNRNLTEMVDKKTFRFDLFHRLAVVFLRIPPLRAHTEDIPALVKLFFEARGVDPGAIDGENLRKLVS